MKRNNPIDVCREVIEQMYHCPRLVHGHPEPVYFLKTDTIYMPKAETFKTQQDYLVAFFKPLVASCKHESRLDWTDLAEYAKFDPAARAQEELIVKIGMFFLRNFTGLAVKSKEYNQSIIQDWIERFRRNPTLAHEASLKAQEAFEFITGMIFDKKEALEMIEDDKLPF